MQNEIFFSSPEPSGRREQAYWQYHEPIPAISCASKHPPLSQHSHPSHICNKKSRIQFNNRSNQNLNSPEIERAPRRKSIEVSPEIIAERRRLSRRQLRVLESPEDLIENIELLAVILLLLLMAIVVRGRRRRVHRSAAAAVGGVLHRH